MKKTNMQSLSLFSLTWPIFIEVSLYMLMGNADTLMLSQYSDNSVAAVGVSNQMLNLIIVMFGFIATGTTVVISQYLGAKQNAKAMKIGYISISTNLIISLFISAAIYLFAEPLLLMMGLSEKLLSEAAVFLKIVGGLSFIQALIMTFSAILKSYGFTKDMMAVTIGMNMLNITGNYFAIFGPFGLPVLGVTGVALSTSISRILGLVVIIFLVKKRIGMIFLSKQFFLIKKEYLKKLLKIGIPSAGEQLSYNASQMIITYFITLLGAQALTTKVYTQNLMMLIMLFGIAISQGTQILIGHYIGAKQFNAAYSRCLKSLWWALAVTTVTSFLLAVFSKPLIGIFSSNSEIIATASMLMFMTIILEPGRSFNVIIINSLRAAGDAKFPVYMAIISMWGIGLPIAYIFGIHLNLGLAGIWFSFIADEWVRGILMYRRWRSKIWIEKGLAA
ncbi:MATE family efflux transporter [Bacillus changyiensis]|uniref:MATE family efflux transporter n=1 Tax=Bacillus changyiensis TaxID=3004103 RepID=UPI0022E37A0D|nr:MATE family efflux transporter [Bacillus changyiensis]MDA1475961.1 MATE family efflux transporter [Bacillus changyiensis]